MPASVPCPLKPLVPSWGSKSSSTTTSEALLRRKYSLLPPIRGSSPTMADATHTLKLTVDPNLRRVVFAEASGAAIEFIHSILDKLVNLPLGTVSSNACIGNVFDLVDKLDAHAASDAAAASFSFSLSRPPSPSPCALHHHHQQQQRKRRREEERFFVCDGGCGGYVADRSGARCPCCGGPMEAEVPPGCPGAGCSAAAAADDDDAAGAAGGSGGRKKERRGELTCLLMDDLSVMSATAASGAGLRLASTFMMSLVAPGVLQLQETVVRLGYREAMEIVETSLQSSNVLTDVFLSKKARPFGKSPL